MLQVAPVQRGDPAGGDYRYVDFVELHFFNRRHELDQRGDFLSRYSEGGLR
jgi:hypothetical protein